MYRFFRDCSERYECRPSSMATFIFSAFVGLGAGSWLVIDQYAYDGSHPNLDIAAYFVGMLGISGMLVTGYLLHKQDARAVFERRLRDGEVTDIERAMYERVQARIARENTPLISEEVHAVQPTQ